MKKPMKQATKLTAEQRRELERKFIEDSKPWKPSPRGGYEIMALEVED